MTSTKTKQMFLTAAPIGSVAKYVNPEMPRYIPKAFLSLFTPEARKDELEKRLLQEGWAKTDQPVLSLAINTNHVLPKADLKSLSEEKQKNALDFLDSHNWSDKETTWEKERSSPSANTFISLEDIQKIPDQKLQARFYFDMSSQGWKTDEIGNLEWTYKAGEPVIQGKMLEDLTDKAPDFLRLLNNAGWQEQSEGYVFSGRGYTPHLPIFPEKLAEESYQCYLAGASIIHLHTRDLNSRPFRIPGIHHNFLGLTQNNSIDPKQYEKIVPSLRDKSPNVIINLSTSARNGATAADDPKRRNHLKKYKYHYSAEIASFSPGPVIFQQGGGYDNPDAFLENQKQAMAEQDIRPEFEIFNTKILNNVVGSYAGKIREMGSPPLFMLVTGVDQYSYWPEELNSLENEDNSLIEPETKKEILSLIKTRTPESLKIAAKKTIAALSPHVEKIRKAHPSSKISTLMAGNMQFIAADVAIGLGLDGIRMGLEDGLSILDPKVPGASRRAESTADQIRKVRSELEAKGIKILSADELRDQLGMLKAEVAIFRQIEKKVANIAQNWPKSGENLDTHKVLESLDNPVSDYLKIEQSFIEDVFSEINDYSDTPEKLAAFVRDIATRHGIIIRFFLEEADRYPEPSKVDQRYIYDLQALNFMREVLADKDQKFEIFDKALVDFANKKNLQFDPLITRTQFKDTHLRFLDFATFTSMKYSLNRTLSFNTTLRQDRHYSATMAILFALIEDKMRALRDKSNAQTKHPGAQWYKAIATGEKTPKGLLKITFNSSNASNLWEHVKAANWITMPSTPATNYPKGHELIKGLNSVLQDFVYNSNIAFGETKVGLNFMAACHAGVDEKGANFIESSMLKNRFSLNADNNGTLAGYSVKQIYDQMLLPRIICNKDALIYNTQGLAVRDEEGFPLNANGKRILRLKNQDLERIDFLRLIGHSSGIATVQQLDNLLRKDMILLGFNSEEQARVFSKAILVHFGTAANVNLTLSGTSIIDVTAANDIRSIAGREEPQDVELSESVQKAFIERRIKSRRQTERIPENNNDAKISIQTGSGKKSLIRYWPIFISEDPARMHDGHSIKRYVSEAPDHLKALVTSLNKKTKFDNPQALIDEAAKLLASRDLEL